MLQTSRIRLRFYILPLIFSLITVYFTYHLIEGERGILRLFEVNQELAKAQQLLTCTNEQKEIMEKRIKLLSSNELNADMLDTVIRDHLDFLEKDEFVIFN